MNEAEETAKKRFMILNLVRLLGVACIFAGMANAQGRLLPDLSPWLGYFLVVSGMVDFFLAPKMLKKVWRSEQP